MHRVDPAPGSYKYCGYNSLTEADFNRDGFTDYLVIHEFGLFKGLTILLHPGTLDQPLYDYWEKIEILATVTNEHANVGDFDGDGRIDLVSVEGSEREAPSQIRILWGPDVDEIRNADAWEPSASFGPLDGKGNPHFSEVRDIDQDGDLDIFIGGRKNPRNGTLVGIHWIENPGDQARAIANWKVHPVDAKLWSGHGFRFFDLDEDGDEDILVNNADFDTPTDEIAILWYENTENKSSGAPWPRHVVDTDDDFFYKVKVAAGDLDGDGLSDLVCPIGDDRIALYRKRRPGSLDYEKIVIQKTGDAVQLQRFIEVVDMNGDGQMDLLCGTLHYFERNKDYGFPYRAGFIAPEKYLLYWMEYTGDKPESDNWIYHPIKRSYGFDTGAEWRGEKVDNVQAKDMDGDGDLDIIVNSEETFINLEGKSNNWTLRNESKAIHTHFGIAWFENAASRIVASDDFESGTTEGGKGFDGSWQTRGPVRSASDGLEGEKKLVISPSGAATRKLENAVHEGQLEYRWKSSGLESTRDQCLVEVYDGSWHTLRAIYLDDEEPGVVYRNEMLALSKFDGVTQIRFSNKSMSPEATLSIDELVVRSIDDK